MSPKRNDLPIKILIDTMNSNLMSQPLKLHVHKCNDQSYLHITPSVQIYELFIYSLLFFTFYKYIMNSKSDQLPAGLIAQLVEHCTSHRFESHSGLNFFRLQFHNCLSCVFVFCRSFSCYGLGARNKTEKLSIDARQSLKGLHNHNTT